ncbi:MAG TPA: AAA family ATPase, partial [Candidatus Tectomicrobia bacterium]
MICAFGEYTFDTQLYELCRAGELIHLEPQVFNVLSYLVQHRHRVVTKQELFERLWPGQFVGDDALERCVRVARRAIGDTRHAPQLIQTIRGRGYRFMASVEVRQPEALSDEGPAAPPIPLLPVSQAAEPSHGRHQAADTWRLSQPVARVQSARFVGREGELAQMYQWFCMALQGKRQVGIVVGEPGIGKTALVNTFVAQVTAVAPFMLGHGQCVESYGAGEPYRPVLEALGRLCREPDGTRLVAVLRQYAPSWLVQMPALLPPTEWEALQRMMGHTAQTRMLRELTEALDIFTTECPVVLVLEDLHWSDRATLEWLAYVARR